MKKTLLFISIFIASMALAAQDGITLHFMRLNPYSQYSNPSAFIPYTGHVGITGISNVNVSVQNSGLLYKRLFGSNSDGTITTLKLNTLADKMSKRGNYLNTNIGMNIIDFGFRVKQMYFSFSYRLRSDEYLFFNRDVVALPVHGNMYYAYQNKTARPELSLNLNIYQEFSLGIQVEITPQIYIGVRPKLLFGLAHAKTKSAYASIYTNPDDYTMSINHKLDAELSCFIPYSINIDTTDLSGINFYPEDLRDNWPNLFKNMGAAIDLGFTYRISNMFGVSASILDLGFIRWKTNNYLLRSSTTDAGSYYNDGSFMFTGLSYDDIERFNEDPDGLEKELLNYFPVDASPAPAYTRMLAGRFLVEGYCNVGKHHRFTALFQGRIVNKQFLPSFTVAWSGTFLNIFDLCVNYTIAKKSYGNLGLGVGFNLGVFHIYAATDNIFGFCNSKSPKRSILNTHTANIQAGIVFDWGKVQETKHGQTAKTKKIKKEKKTTKEENTTPAPPLPDRQ